MTVSREAKKESFFIKYLLSCASAAVAETVTYPLDITKTRLQLQNEMTNKSSVKVQSQGMFRTAYNIAHKEGLRSLWAGITPAVLRHCMYTGSRLIIYEKLRGIIRERKTKPGDNSNLGIAVLVGTCSGALAQFIASPTDLVKVMMQADGKRKLEGKKPRIKGVGQAFKEIYMEAGIKGLWRGSIVNVQRAALVNLGDLGTYDLVKHYLIRNVKVSTFKFQDDYRTHIVSSLASGLISAIFGTPADVIKTRIMNQPLDSKGRGLVYTSSWHCLKSTVTNEGFMGLYKGFFPTWLRMAPWSLTFWITYEQIRKMSGLSGF